MSLNKLFETREVESQTLSGRSIGVRISFPYDLSGFDVQIEGVVTAVVHNHQGTHVTVKSAKGNSRSFTFRPLSVVAIGGQGPDAAKDLANLMSTQVYG